jgi:MSHA biogenesis protein MshE
MGVKSYLLASALHAVLAQRLVRRVCESCAAAGRLDANELAWVRAIGGERAAGIVYRAGTGCSHCNGTGYRGRIGVYELLEVGGELSEALARGDIDRFAMLARGARGYRSMEQLALVCAVRGVTTVAEAMRVGASPDASPEPIATPAAESPA